MVVNGVLFGVMAPIGEASIKSGWRPISIVKRIAVEIFISSPSEYSSNIVTLRTYIIYNQEHRGTTEALD